jgi:hypothetical protein
MTDIRTRLVWRGGIIAVFGLVLCGVVGIAVHIAHPSSESMPSQIRSLGPTISQLERIGELTSMRIHVADILTADGDGLRGSWLIRGDAVLSCDISRAKIVRIDSVHRTATLCLPRPRVRSSRVDHAKSKTWSVEKTTWLPWSGGDQSTFRDAAMYHAQQLIEASALSDHHLESAQKQTELLVQRLYEAMGWEVNIKWE